MLSVACRLALKEWAVTVRALDLGEQIILLRKGGIREEGKDFRVVYPEFLLYPTFEHQKQELLKEGYHDGLQQVPSPAQPQQSITFSNWARVEETIELGEQDEVDSLYPHHIWTQDYALNRLHWKPRHPLSILLLRVYRLERPQSVDYLPAFGGCKSWVELSSDVPLGRLTPVLADDEFQRSVGEVKGALAVHVG